MKINCIYFSPTGGTERVVSLLSKAWGEEAHHIDISVADKDYSGLSFGEELCIIGVPSFGGRVPAVALAHLKQLKAANTPAVIVAAFGNRDYDDTLLELQNTVEESGFHVVAAVAAVTEHSIMHQFGTARPDEADRKELLEYANKIKQALEGGEVLPKLKVKGNIPYREYGGLPLKPSAGKSCLRCGDCAKVCPVSAIPAHNPGETDKALCITCMRCVAVCPKHARKLNSMMLFAAGKKMESVCTSRKSNELFL